MVPPLLCDGLAEVGLYKVGGRWRREKGRGTGEFKLVEGNSCLFKMAG